MASEKSKKKNSCPFKAKSQVFGSLLNETLHPAHVCGENNGIGSFTHTLLVMFNNSRFLKKPSDGKA